MILTTGDFSAFLQYAVSFFSLSLPFIVVLLMIVIWVHYRNKKRKNTLLKSDTIPNTGFEKLPEQSQPMPPLSVVDRLSVIKNCREQLSGSKAKYVALKYDYISMQRNGTGLYSSSPDKKNKSMENFHEKIAAYEKQATELQNKIEMLETIPAPQNNEAHCLRELLTEKEKEIQELHSTISHLEQVQTSQTGSVTNMHPPDEQQQEIEKLKKIISEQAYLSDMVEESKQQVGFLQSQLEQRVKANKMMEQKLAAASEELSQAQFQFYEAGKKSAETEQLLQAKDKEIEQLQLEINTKENDLRPLLEKIHFKNDQLLAVENSFKETRRQNELLNASVADNQDIISSLRDQLAGERQQNENLQEKLRKNRQILHRFYKELESSVEGAELEEEKKGNLVAVA